MKVGVLAIQGDFAAHVTMLAELGADAREVRTPEQLAEVESLVIPGGESTTITMGMASSGLDAEIKKRHAEGMAVMGSCAGLIVCDRDHLGLGDYSCERNAFGRQLQSFEADLEITGVGNPPMRAVFIRAPWVSEHGAGVEVLASVEGHPVAIRSGRLLGCAFHPELTGDTRLHASFLELAGADPV